MIHIHYLWHIYLFLYNIKKVTTYGLVPRPKSSACHTGNSS